MAETFTTYRRGNGEAVIAGRRRLTRMNGAVTLHSCTSSNSSGGTSWTRSLQLLVGARSGTSPPASIGVAPAVRASTVRLWAPILLRRLSSPAADGPPRCSSSGTGPSGTGADSAALIAAYEPGDR